MKNLIINFIFLIWSSNIFASTIYVGNDSINTINTGDLSLASLVKSSNTSGCSSIPGSSTQCDFIQTFTTDHYRNDAELEPIVNSDYRTSVKSTVPNAYIDLGFNDDVINGAGNDLILFFVGNTTTFSLDVYDNASTPQLINTIQHTLIAPTFGTGSNVSDYGDAVRDATKNERILLDGFQLSAILIDFGDSYEGTGIGSLHLTLENSNFALAGGFHTNTAVVPLPLSVVLFSSGLALLGWVGRRKIS